MGSGLWAVGGTGRDRAGQAGGHAEPGPKGQGTQAGCFSSQLLGVPGVGALTALCSGLRALPAQSEPTGPAAGLTLEGRAIAGAHLCSSTCKRPTEFPRRKRACVSHCRTTVPQRGRQPSARTNTVLSGTHLRDRGPRVSWPNAHSPPPGAPSWPRLPISTQPHPSTGHAPQSRVPWGSLSSPHVADSVVDT